MLIIILVLIFLFAVLVIGISLENGLAPRWIAIALDQDGPPHWQISAWKADGKGGWQTQPVLTIRRKRFRFETPQEYIQKLRLLQELLGHYPDADVGDLERVIEELQGAQLSFIRHPTSRAPLARTPPMARSRGGAPPQQQQASAAASALRFSCEVDERNKVPIANMVRSIYGNNPDGFTYWRDELLNEPAGDAAEYAGAVLAGVWANAIVQHTMMFWHVKSFEALPHSVYLAFEDALDVLELLFSYDMLPLLQEIVVPDDTPIPEDPLDRAKKIIDWMESDIADEDDHRALLQIADQAIGKSALRTTLISITAAGANAAEGMPIDFSGLAAMLARFAEAEEQNTSLAKRCRKLAIACAKEVPREEITYANIVTSFRDGRIDVPEFMPHPVGDHSIRVEFDGSLKVVVRGAPMKATAHGAPVKAPAAAGSPSRECLAASEAEVLRGIERSLMGLVGLDKFKALFAMDVFDFLSAGQSRGRVFWGASGVGKTEVAQRLAGLREGFPGLAIGAGEVRYISGVDGRLEIKELIDTLPPRSLVFVDEADKCIDPNAGMVSAAEATQVRHAIVTHFQRKPVLWIFLGVFAAMRTGGRLTDDSLRANFGDELAHRLDYADWGFPSWTLENLLRAINGSSSRRTLKYEDDAVLILARYCIMSGGGVRAFDNLETAIKRHLRTSGRTPDSSVSADIVREILSKRGVQAS